MAVVHSHAVIQDIEVITDATGHVKILLHQNDDAVLFNLIDGFNQGVDNNRRQAFGGFVNEQQGCLALLANCTQSVGAHRPSSKVASVDYEVS